MKIKVFQKGFNYSQDGPGNRLVYHLQGCNMSCPWCANPEGMAHEGCLLVKTQHLIDDICPRGAIRQKAIDREICNGCHLRECISLHKTKGIRLSYQTYEIDELVDEARRSSALFYDGGGVTLSGGEATLQFEAVCALLKGLKEADIHTAIETNGSHPKLGTLFPLIDLLIMDFKHYDSEIHESKTGIGNAVIRTNLMQALGDHPNVLIRIPLIKGFNDAKEDAKHFAAFFKQYDTSHASFEFLPYHEYGMAKWEQCGMAYRMHDAYVDTKTIMFYEELFSESNLSVIHT
ncbi:MAG: glycyl-radical enzyme activating protein family [Clostridia bacterium]|jgi:pyruvate formate lyase activating enzyme|nr:glycyl-radical enzyme activating protein family [Clostridia bacterium]